MISSHRSKPWLWSRSVCREQWGKGRQKNFGFLSLITLDFPLSAMSQNYLKVESFPTHSAKSLLTPSQKSTSSVCLWVPFSMNHIITCQPLPVVCQYLYCTTDVLRNISRRKSGACVLTVAHTYTYCRNSITSSFSNISSTFFRAPTLPKKQHPGTVAGLPDLSWFLQSSNSQWSRYFHSRATPASGLTHLVPCLWQWQWCMFPEKTLSSFQSFSSVYHNRCVSIAEQMFLLLCVAILVIQTNRPAGAQHISLLSKTHRFPPPLQHACHQGLTRGCSCTQT